MVGHTDVVRLVIATLCGLNVALIAGILSGYEGVRSVYVRAMGLWGILGATTVALGNYALRGNEYTVRTWLSLVFALVGLGLFGRMVLDERRRQPKK